MNTTYMISLFVNTFTHTHKPDIHSWASQLILISPFPPPHVPPNTHTHTQHTLIH